MWWENPYLQAILPSILILAAAVLLAKSGLNWAVEAMAWWVRRAARRNPPTPVLGEPVAHPVDASPAEVATYWDEWHPTQWDWERDHLDYSPWLPLVLRLQASGRAGRILSLGAGRDLDPYLWADCGMTVEAVDISGVLINQRLRQCAGGLAAALEEAWLRPSLAPHACHRRPGGSVCWIRGDFRDPAVAPGEFDIVEISRVLQYYVRLGNAPLLPEEAAIFAGLMARVAPGGTLLLSAHNGAHLGIRGTPWLVSQGYPVFRYREDMETQEGGTPREDGKRVILRVSSG